MAVEGGGGDRGQIEVGIGLQIIMQSQTSAKKQKFNFQVYREMMLVANNTVMNFNGQQEDLGGQDFVRDRLTVSGFQAIPKAGKDPYLVFNCKTFSDSISKDGPTTSGRKDRAMRQLELQLMDQGGTCQEAGKSLAGQGAGIHGHGNQAGGVNVIAVIHN